MNLQLIQQQLDLLYSTNYMCPWQKRYISKARNTEEAHGLNPGLGYTGRLKEAELPTCFACSTASDLSWVLFSSLQIRGKMTKPRNPMMKGSPQGYHCISVNMIVSVESTHKAIYI